MAVGFDLVQKKRTIADSYKLEKSSNHIQRGAGSKISRINKINNLKERIMKDIFKKSDNKKELIDGLEKDEK